MSRVERQGAARFALVDDDAHVQPGNPEAGHGPGIGPRPGTDHLVFALLRPSQESSRSTWARGPPWRISMRRRPGARVRPRRGPRRRPRRRTIVPDGREGQGMEREGIKGAFEVDGLRRDINVFDACPADPDRFLAANKDRGYAARKPKTGSRRLQNGPRPAVAERSVGSGPEKLTAATDGALARRAPAKMVGAAGFEPATPTPPV